VSLYFDNLRISLVIIGKLKWLKVVIFSINIFFINIFFQEVKLNSEKVI